MSLLIIWQPRFIWVVMTGLTTIVKVLRAMMASSTSSSLTWIRHSVTIEVSVSPPPFTETGLNRFLRLCEVAERANVDLAFENLRAPGRLYEFMQRIDSPRIGVCFDAGHNHCFCPDRRICRDFGDRIKAVHLHDNDGTQDAHNIPGDGTIDWRIVRSELIDSAYRGAWSLEIEHPQTEQFGKALPDRTADPYFGMDPEEYLDRAFRAHQKLIAGDL